MVPVVGHTLTRRDLEPKTQVAIIAVCVVLIVLIFAGATAWFFFRLRNKPKRVKNVDTKSAIRIDDGEREVASESLIDERSVAMSSVRPAASGIESWLQQTQRAAPVGPQDTPRTPGRTSLHEPALPPSPPPPATYALPRAASPPERPVSTHSSTHHQHHPSHSQSQLQSQSQPHPHTHADDGHQRTGSGNHARPLAFIKHIFTQPHDAPATHAHHPPPESTTPSIARLPMMPVPPSRSGRPDSLILSDDAYEITPDASASQYGGPSRRRRGSGSSDVVPPMPELPRGGFNRRQSYGALSSQGGLPLPSFYLPSEQGDGSQPALAIGESVLASPLDPRPFREPPRRGGPRRPGSNFVVVNATEDD